jgi:nicotinamide-nucleotide amidase
MQDAAALEDLERKYAERGRTVTAASRRQALVLEGAEVLRNPVGMAPGQRLDLPEGRVLFILPGPPKEFAGVLDEWVVPWLSRFFGPQAVRVERVCTTCGIGESDLVTRFEAAGFPPDGVTACYYPGGGQVEIRLSAAQGGEALLEQAEQELRRLLGDQLMPHTD